MRKIKQILAFAHNVSRYVKWNTLKREKKNAEVAISLLTPVLPLGVSVRFLREL